jgi:hypothetical protein
MKKVFGMLAVAALLVLPVAAYAGTVVGHGVFDEETDTVTLPPVTLEETKTEVVNTINSAIKENSAITGGKEVVKITVSTSTNETTAQVTVDRTKLEAVADGRKIESVVAPLPALTVPISSTESPVNVILTVPTENFKDIAVENILFFLENRKADENAIHVDYKEQVESNDDDESYVFVNNAGDKFGRAASEETPNLIIRNLKYNRDYNFSLNTSTSPAQAVSFANGNSITFRSEFVEAAASSYSDGGGGCDAGLAPLALAVLAGIAFVFKKD